MTNTSVLEETNRIYNKNFQDVKTTAEELGITGRAVYYRLQKYKNLQDNGWQEKPAFETEKLHAAEKQYIVPNLPNTKMDTDDLIEHLCSRYRTHDAANKARLWFPIKILVEGPYAISFVGDPHMDDNGCNWPQLRKDMDTVRDTEAMWSVGMGDYTNNWIGRLKEKKYPGQEATKDQAWQLAEWFFARRKANGQSQHILLIKGNHDLWSGNADPLDWMASRGETPLEDWQATVKFVSPNGLEVPMWIAHNFKGNSMWNMLHGNQKKAQFNGEAKVYVCGDKHNWALSEIEDQERPGNVYWLARARGYKYIDEYARDLGFGSQQYGATITAVIDPHATGTQQIRLYPDVQEAADFLTWKRSKK